MSDYGKLKPLNEILQELVDHCVAITGEDVELKLHLPKSVLGEYSRAYLPHERVVLFGEVSDPQLALKKIHLTGGTVELES
jgi:hypothetical protein